MQYSIISQASFSSLCRHYFSAIKLETCSILESSLQVSACCAVLPKIFFVIESSKDMTIFLLRNYSILFRYCYLVPEFSVGSMQSEASHRALYAICCYAIENNCFVNT